MIKQNPVEVLIVDDREDGLIALEAVLQDMPLVKLVRASSGQQALDLLHDHDFAVILLDVQMPQMDGFQTAQMIRIHNKYRLTPIIFVTAINKDDQYIFKGYEAGAVDYIFKPFEPHVLRSKVNVFIELYRKSRQLAEQADLIRQSERRDRYLKLAELEVENLKRYRNLADAIPHIVWKAKVDGTVDYFNKVWTDYTGLSAEQSVGSGWHNSFDDDDLGYFLKVWIQAMNSNQPFEVEARIRHREGEMRWHWIRAVPEKRHNNDVVAWLGTCTDIHDRKKSEEELLQAQRIAVDANLAKTNFLANMSHEIRTPMGAILGFTELMLNPSQTEEERLQSINTIRRNGQQLLYIIDEILDISKIESGHLEVEEIEINFSSILNDLQSLLTVQTQRKGLSLEFVLEGPIPEHIYSDAMRIRQIFMNIIGNAIKFTEKGKIEVRINWLKSDQPNSGYMQVRVKDSGIGIEPKHVGRLFQPFVQVDNSTTRRFGGTGLGLALSRQLAQALGGDVVLESSAPGEGSTFEIILKSKLKEGTTWIEKLKPIAAEKPSRKRDKEILKDARILVVDDAPDNQTIIGYFLNAAGAKVDFADNGVEGVEKALSGNHNIVLMDIQMPQVDGYEATRRLREKGYKKPIVALTAHALKEERERCLSVGCNEHFTKPVDRSKLISLVDKLIHQN